MFYFPLISVQNADKCLIYDEKGNDFFIHVMPIMNISAISTVSKGISRHAIEEICRKVH